MERTRVLSLRHDMFYKDALILDQLSSRKLKFLAASVMTNLEIRKVSTWKRKSIIDMNLMKMALSILRKECFMEQVKIVF